MSTMMTLRQCVALLPGARCVGDEDTPIGRVHTDTRTIEAGDLFVALRGERFDANQFLHQAQAQGAAALLCHAGLPASAYPAGVPRIEVADSQQALQQLAHAWRAQFTLPVIAVTGSNGKTTVTQMIASILRAHCAAEGALATQGNFNNDIGVPLTLLRLRPQHRMAVVELGMNHPGEIAQLAAWTQPTVALVNNAQREHLEFMQTVEAVAQENGAVISALGAQGVAVFPADDAYSAVWQRLADGRTTLQFAADGQHAETLHVVQADWVHGAWQVQVRCGADTLRYRLAIAGRHNVKNSLAAAACALAAGVPPAAVERGLESFVPVKGRSRALALHMGGREYTVVDDTYNANPDSVRAAIDVLAELPGPRLLVLGDMGEVGQEGPAFHAEVGRYAQSRGLEHLLALGVLAHDAASAFAGARHCASMDELHAEVQQRLPQVRSILVKGSRFMRMERVVEQLQAWADQAEGATHAS